MGEASESTGLLSVVGTPIGNLRDASPRVLDTLAAADVVLCEDTRVTGRLMSAFGLHVRLERCDENVMAEKVERVLERLAAGERVAFVSDAGMPGVSDPGQRLVDAALDAGLRVEVVPGPSAVTCALVASGLASEHFFFEGFLPRRPGAQRSRLEELAAVPGTLVVYESPRRAAETLARIAEVMPGRRVALVRELTKLHEEVVRGEAAELAAEVAARGEVRGECVIVIAAPGAGELEERRAAAAGTGRTLEEEIAAAACSSFDENDIRDIRENVELWKDAIARQDQQKIMELDKAFHRILYLRAGFPNWYDLVESYAPHFDRTASLSFRLLPKDHILSDHMALADAIASGNAADARRIARRHMERYCENIGEIRKIYPDYFLF